MKITKVLKLAAAAGVLTIAAIPVRADVIDFEAGFSNLDPVGLVTTTTNAVTFSIGDGVSGGVPAIIADVAGTITAFAPNDTPVGGAAGSFFLTDEEAGPSAKLDYFMTFDNPVLDLSLDLFDYRVDGGPAIGDTATLFVYSDAAWTTSIGATIFAVIGTEDDGNVETLSVSGQLSILSAAVIMSTGDVGTGIDNVTFRTKVNVPAVPEPVSLLLLGLGLVGIGVTRRRTRHS